jgi:2,5-diketo-D-gluconate reductase A
MPQQPRLTLNDGTTIPQLGFGVWQVSDAEAPAAVGEAIRVGYRLIDTAQAYQNETGVGVAIRESDCARDRLYITSKLQNKNQGYGSALSTFDETMQRLGLEVLDLFLIHWPMPGVDRYVESWKALIRLREEGRVRSIGVSNFNIDHLERIIGETGVVPVVNQVELHPGYQQLNLRDFHKQHAIAIESWSPLGRGEFFRHPVIDEIASKHGKTAAQTLLRWHIDQGLIVIPKSVTPARIAENFNIFDFALDAEDMAAIAELDDVNGKRGGRPETNNNM